jgi:hypothetical protein
VRTPLLLLALTLSACSGTEPGVDVLGLRFPEARGESLAGQPVQLPSDFAGAPVVLLLGYVQNAQFDADRWLYGLLQADPPVRVVEVPTIRGLAAGLAARQIDAGMRSGIPAEDWGSVVTLYGGEAAGIVRLTGNENPRNVRVLLLDGEGYVRWFHDRGFSAGVLLELEQEIRALVAAPNGS